MIPCINRTSDIILSSHLEARDVNVREVIDEFQSQIEDFESIFEPFVLMAPGRVHVTCKSAHKLEITEKCWFCCLWPSS